MPLATIERGSHVMVRCADGRLLTKIATSGVVNGYSFLVVWACTEEEWITAQVEGREPNAMPWPAETVSPV